MSQRADPEQIPDDDQQPEILEYPDDDSGTSPEPPAPSPEIEHRARALGWHPLDEFRGDPETWKSAEDFLRISEKSLPVMRSNMRRLEKVFDEQGRELQDVKTKLGEQTQVLTELRDMARRTDERAYQRALANLKSKQRQAVADGDTAAFDEVDEQIRTVETARAEVVPKPAPPAEPPKPALPPPSAEVQAFIDRNEDWFNRDQEMTNFASATDATLQASPKWKRVPVADRFAEVERRVHAEFPDYFGTPDESIEEEPLAQEPPVRSRRPAAPVARPRGGSAPIIRPPRQATGIDTIQDPVERQQARESFQRMVRQFGADYTETEFMAVYSDPHTDILAVQEAQRKRNNGK